ncbi:MAG: CvpA family protein [Sphaerochaetaceae bacterium]|nr:CvpA family protein [Sphaerochaetaceae bacterium]
MSALNTLDYIIFVFAMIWAVWGAIKGFLEELSQKFGYVIGFLTGLMFTASLAGFFEERLSIPYWIAAFAAYVILFLLGYLFIKVIGNVLQTIFKTANLSVLDNFLGFFLGLFEAIIILGVLERLLLNQSVISISNYIEGSFFSQKILLPFMNFISSFVKGLW